MNESTNPITPQMRPDELRDFLSKPFLMNIATITPEGYPHVTPVWFDYDGEIFLVTTTDKRKKARNLSRLPRAGFSIAEPNLPYKAVVGYGDVTIEDDPERNVLKKLVHKYLPTEKADKYFKELAEIPGSQIVLKIKPRWMLSWTGE